MKTQILKSLPVVAAGSLLLLGYCAVTLAAEGATEEVTVTAKKEYRGMQHEFEIQSGEKLVLAHRHRIARYRICVNDFKNSVPLKVYVDDTSNEVPVGACGTVTGKHIAVEPGGELPGGQSLVARYRQVGKPH